MANYSRLRAWCATKCVWLVFFLNYILQFFQTSVTFFYMCKAAPYLLLEYLLQYFVWTVFYYNCNSYLHIKYFQSARNRKFLVLRIFFTCISQYFEIPLHFQLLLSLCVRISIFENNCKCNGFSKHCEKRVKKKRCTKHLHSSADWKYLLRKYVFQL